MHEGWSWVRGWTCVAWLLIGCGADALEHEGCEDCEPDAPVAACRDGSTSRPPRAPEPGTLRITEWMADPDGSDAELEWVEVSFESAADLYGIELGPSLDVLHAVIEGDDCVPVDAGSRIVIGASPAAAPRVDAELPFSLGNSGLRAIVVAEGGRLLDRVEYVEAIEGVAWQLDSSGTLCEARDPYFAANLGTPGYPNPACPAVLSAGECFDEGLPRAIVVPRSGDAIISEWMANPDAVDNRDGEWVEVRFSAAADANGLVLSDLAGAEATVESEHCVAVPPNGHVVFARNVEPLENGGVEPVVAPLSLSLNNRNEQLTLRVGEQVLDVVAYDGAESGVATQVDDDGRVCAAVDLYGDGDLGTPGAPNPSCF